MPVSEVELLLIVVQLNSSYPKIRETTQDNNRRPLRNFVTVVAQSRSKNNFALRKYAFYMCGLCSNISIKLYKNRRRELALP